MKHLILKSTLLTPLFLLACTLQAQTEKGRLLVGATTHNLSMNVERQSSALAFDIHPQVGYFVMDHLALGTRLGFGHSFHRMNGFTQSRTTSLSGGVFARYYVPLSERIKLPIEVEGGIGYARNRSATAEGDFTSAYAGASTGLALFLNKHVSIDLMVGYRRSQPLNVPSPGSGRLVGNIGFNIFLK